MQVESDIAERPYADDDYRYTREKSNLFLQHDLLITKIHLTLELATRGTSLELVAWGETQIGAPRLGRGRWRTIIRESGCIVWSQGPRET